MRAYHFVTVTAGRSTLYTQRHSSADAAREDHERLVESIAYECNPDALTIKTTRDGKAIHQAIIRNGDIITTY